MVFDPLIKPWKREEVSTPVQSVPVTATSTPMSTTPIGTGDPLIKPWKSASTSSAVNSATEIPEALKLDTIQGVEYAGPKTGQKNFFNFIGDLKIGLENKDLKKITSTLTNYGEYKGTFNDLILHPYLAGFHGGSAAWNMAKGVGSIAHVLLENGKPQADDYENINGKMVFNPGKGAERNADLMKNALLGVGKDFYQHWIEPTMATDIQLQTMINPLVSRHTTPEQKEQIGYWAEKSRQNLNDYRTYEWDAFFSDVVVFGMAGVNLASKTPLWADMEKAAYKAGLTGKYAPGSDLSELGLTDDLMKAKGQEELNSILASKKAKVLVNKGIPSDLIDDLVKADKEFGFDDATLNIAKTLKTLKPDTPWISPPNVAQAGNEGLLDQAAKLRISINTKGIDKLAATNNVAKELASYTGRPINEVSKVAEELVNAIPVMKETTVTSDYIRKLLAQVKTGTTKVSELFPEIKMLETTVDPYFHRQYKLYDKSLGWKPDSNDLKIVKEGLSKQGLSPLEADGIIEQTLDGKILPIFDKGRVKAISYSGGSLKHRENIPEYIRTHLLGEVTQPGAKFYETLRVQKNNQTWGQLYYKWAQNPNLVSDTIRPGFAKMPKDPQFGALSDKYVRQQLLDELIPAKDSATNIVAQAFKAVDQWLYQPIKTGLTVGSPGGQARNIYADAYFLWMAGTEPQDVLRAIKSMIKQDRLYFQATKNRVIHTDFARNETLMKWLSENEPKGESLFNILETIAKAPVRGLKTAWSFPDDVTKLATFYSRLRKRDTYANAAKFTRDVTPYYDDPSKFAQLMKGTVSPFFMFTNEAIRTQLIGGAIHQPVRAVVAVQMPNLAREFAKQQLEIQDETYNKLVRAIPSYIRDQQWIPVSKEGNKVMIMSVGSALPLSNVSGLIPQSEDSPGKNIARVVNNPLLGAFTQLTTGVAPGQEGYTTSVEKILPEEKNKRILGKSAMSVLPGLSRLNGRLVTAQGENALQKPWMVAVDYGIGAKFYIIDLDQFDKTTTQSMRGTVSDTKSALRSIMKKQKEGTLTPEEKDDFIKRLQEGARKKLEDLKKQREGRSALPGNLVAMGEIPKAAKNQVYEENLQKKLFPNEWNKQYGSKT